jgi:hypothetical protein
LRKREGDKKSEQAGMSRTGIQKEEVAVEGDGQPHPLVDTAEAYHPVAEEGCGGGGAKGNFEFG